MRLNYGVSCIIEAVDLYRILQIIKSGTTNYCKSIKIYCMRLNYSVSCIIEAVDLYQILQLIKSGATNYSKNIQIQLIILRIFKYIVCA